MARVAAASTNGTNGNGNGGVMQLPHSVEAEEATLGSLMLDPVDAPRIAAFLKPSDFYIVKNGWVYEAIVNAGQSADLLTVSAELANRGVLQEVGGESYIAELTASVPTAMNAVSYARIVENMSARRALLRSASDIAKLAYDQQVSLEALMSGALRSVEAVRKPHTRNISRSAHEIFETLWQSIENRHNDPTLAAGVPTGFKDLDQLLGGGLRKGELMIVAARPGMGKTSLLNCIAANVVGLNRAYRPSRKFVVAYYSMEMSDEELAYRFTAMDTGIDSRRLRMAEIKDEEWAGLTLSMQRHCDVPLHLNCYPQSVESMGDDAENILYRFGLDLIIVDYLGLFRGNGDAYERISRIARELKDTAKRLNVPILSAAQLSRSCESRNDKRPLMSDLRDSGEIEQAADDVLFIYRDDYYNTESEFKNVAEINLSKQRNGPTGVVNLFFDKRLTLFCPLSRERIVMN